jgi:DNA-binding CsgD family transcriptional regulator
VTGARGALSVRERDVLKLLAEGKSSREIAALLTLSPTTISSHRRSICRKLDIHSTAQLVRYAVSNQDGDGGNRRRNTR